MRFCVELDFQRTFENLEITLENLWQDKGRQAEIEKLIAEMNKDLRQKYVCMCVCVFVCMCVCVC